MNHERICRIMKGEKLLRQRHTGKAVRTNDGKVITLCSDTRWCSDAFSIQQWNAEWAHVAFSLDTRNREVIRYIASTIGMDGVMVRDLKAESLETRLADAGADKAQVRVQWLSDNGPGYIAREAVELARTLNLEPCATPSCSPARRRPAALRDAVLQPCATPSCSPESKGMAEAFVKTFKRDYVRSTDLSDAQTFI